MAYTTIDNPEEYFKTVLFTGDGTDNRAITVGFQPDLSFVHQRTDASGGYWVDSVRGNNAALQTSNTNGEGTFADMTFTSTGITVSSNENLNNEDAHNYVSWHWKAGTSFSNDASATSIGDVDSSGSISQTSGFSICSYSGSGSSGDTIKHGLSTAPKMIIIKKRSASDNWTILNTNISLNTHLHFTTDGAVSDPMFTNTAPTTSVFTLDSDGQVNESGHTFIAYCFSEVQGYSKFGSYVANGNANGNFIYTGFKPAFLTIKNTSTGSTNWPIKDNKRSGTAANQNFGQMNPNQIENPGFNTTDAENKASAFAIDLLSNGFKLRGTDNAINNSGDTYIYMCFAEAPFVNSNGVPVNAR